jgi:hypothetical protein
LVVTSLATPGARVSVPELSLVLFLRISHGTRRSAVPAGHLLLIFSLTVTDCPIAGAAGFRVNNATSTLSCALHAGGPDRTALPDGRCTLSCAATLNAQNASMAISIRHRMFIDGMSLI